MSDVTVDARGLACPQPVLELNKAIQEVEVGGEVELLSDDPAAKVDVPVWCRMRKHELSALDELEDALRFVVVRRS